MIRVLLEMVRDNPFQSRMEYGDLDDLADSIVALVEARPDTGGLLQVPPARIVVIADPDAPARVLDPREHELGVAGCLATPGAVVQLAAGHRRARAFDALRRRGHQEYKTFPVEIQVLDDGQMADIARAENADRKDISPIEEALLFQRTLDRLHITQAELGRRWRLSQSAVANTLRLLGLPEDIRAAVHKGELPAHTAREALPLTQIPGFTLTLATLRNASGKNLTSAEVNAYVKDVIKARAADLFDAVWEPRDEWVPTAAPAGLTLDAVVGPCGDCPHRIAVLRHQHCTRKSCFEAKQKIYRRAVTGPAKAADLYTSSRAWRTITVQWQACHACGSHPDDPGIGREGWYTAPQWEKPNSVYYVCPGCWTLAGLPEPTPTPEPAPTPAPAPRPAAAVTHYAPTPAEAEDDGEAEGIEDDGDGDEALAPAVPAPTPAATPRPAPVMREIQPPAPPTSPADVLTARILPGADLDGRRVLVTIGPENAGPAHLRAGAFPALAGLVADLVETYFRGNGHEPASAGEPEILMEV